MTTTDSLRAALKRLTIMANNELDTPGLWAHDRSQWNDAIAAARAALAEPVAEGPTDNDILACMIEAARSVPDGQAIGITDWHCEAIAAARALLARFGNHPAIADSSTCKQSLPVAPAPPAEGEVAELVAPIRQISLAWEPEVVGPTDQELADAFAEGCRDGSKAGEPPFLGGARAILARWGNHSPSATKMVSPAPAPAGEVAEVVAWLRAYCSEEFGPTSDDPDVRWLTRAADLLERLALPACVVLKPSPELIEAFQNALPGRIEPLLEQCYPTPIPISERLPEPSVKVLAHYFNDLGKGRTICAIWVPAKTRSDSYGDDDFTEYDEESDTFYWPEGWYEAIENWDDLGYVKVDEGEVIYWQPLPKWPATALPLPAGEVAELVSLLRSEAVHDEINDHMAWLAPADARRAADLLEQRHPEPVPVTDPTDEQLLATVDAVSVTLPPLPDAHGRINYDIAWRVAMARAVLARWGGQPATPAGEAQP